MLPGRSEAQALTIFASKTLCDAATCPPGPAGPQGPGLTSAAPGAPVFYRIRVQNVGSSSGAVNIADTLPAGFHLTGADCGPTTGPFAPIQSAGGNLVNVAVAGGATVDCRLHGYFDGTATQADNQVDIFGASGGARLFPTIHRATNVDLHAALPADLSVSKEIIDPAPTAAGVHVLDVSNGPGVVTYRITIENRGPSDLYLGRFFELQDQLSLLASSAALNARFLGATCTVVPANAQLAPASDCLAPAPSRLAGTGAQLVGSTALQDFAAWRFPANGPGSDGYLRSGDKMVLEVRMQVSAARTCIIAPGADGILETAHIELAVPGASGGPGTALAETALPPPADPATNNTASIPLRVVTGATQVDPHCNPPADTATLQIRKTEVTPTSAAAPLGWAASATNGPSARYRLTISNLSPTHRIRNIRLVDIVRQGVGTPSFSAHQAMISCNGCAITLPTPAAQVLNGYGTTATMASMTLFGGNSAVGLLPVPPSGIPNSVIVQIHFRYVRRTCDSLLAGSDRIDNIVRVAHWDEVAPDGTVTTVNQPLASVVATHMAEAQTACPLQVNKTIQGGATRIRFNTPVTYVVVFSNPSDTALTVGTLIDTLRFTAAAGASGPYASQLRVDYRYTCAPVPVPGGGAVTGYPATNPAGPTNTNVVFAQASQLVQQGVRLIQNTGPVEFAKHSSLRCVVTLTVRRPGLPPTPDPYCSEALLENAAILDLSAFYNSNLPWPAEPGMWSSVSTPLPDCYNLVVSKDVTPGAATWTWQGGGPLSWTYTVTNLGTPIRIGATQLFDIRDWFTWAPSASVNPTAPLGVTVTGITFQCSAAAGCPAVLTTNPLISPPPGISEVNPVELDTGESLSARIDVAQAPATVPAGGFVCNNVQSFIRAPPAPNDAYLKNLQTLTARSCIPVLATAPLTLRKRIINPHNVIVPQSFGVTVTCEPYPLTPSTHQIPVGPGGSAGTRTILRVPVGDRCSMAEGPLPPLQPRSGCAAPVWDTTYLPPGPITIVSNGNSNQLTVTNTVRCLPVGSIAIRKDTVSPIPYPLTATFDVDCNPYGPHHVPFQATVGQTSVLPNIPVRSVCTLIEQLPSQCGSTVVFDPAGPVTVATPGAQVLIRVHNRFCLPGNGWLRIVKRTWVDGQPAPTSPSLLPFTAPAFPVRITCGQGALQVSLNAGNNFEAQIPVLAGSLCTVEELPPPFVWATPDPDCTWAPFYTPGQQVIVLSGQTTVEILNRQYCHGLFPL